LGGVTWDYIQYVLGLHRMGHDVYYLEDTGQWPYDPSEGGTSAGYEHTISYLDTVMKAFGLADRWMYRFPWGPRWFGLSDRRREEVLESAELIINVSGTLRAPQEIKRRARLVYIDTDPVFTQLKLARQQRDFRALVDAHDVHFSFGELIGTGSGGDLADTGHRWIPTRQPVVVDEWRTPARTHPRDAFTTVMNWTSYKPITHMGRTYGQKDVELERFIDLPARVDVPLELAISPGRTRRTPYGRLARMGWRIVDPSIVCPDPWSYRDYVQSSVAEWSVSKNGYVAGRSGWFSCRTACYLAAGRPAVIQDTGFSEVIPVGSGLHAFQTVAGAASGIEAVMRDYASHARWATELARMYFDHGSVLDHLIEAATGEIAPAASWAGVSAT
jgi:hypothetical protein